jgi:PAS domain S-box-containing protein
MAEVADPERVSILLVDDRPDSLMSVQGLLQRPEYDLVLARSGEAALAQVLRREFAVILLDVAMPGMDGFQVASIIKERDQSRLVPIIFITASVYDMEHIFRGYTVGAVDYLRKPLDPHALRSKVAVFIELFRQRKQIERQAAKLREAELREQQLLRTRAEVALRESESLYQLTFEEAPVGIGFANAEGQLTKVNRHLKEILGYGDAGLLGKRIEDLAIGREAAALGERLSRLRDGAAFYAGEHELRSRTGEGVWVQVTLSALRDPASREAVKFLVVANDISALKRGELERSRLVRDLQQGLRARDDFLSIAAHELKTPVTPLRLQVASLLRDAERATLRADPQLLRRLETMDRAIVRLEELIDRLLDVSRLNVSAIALELAPVDLAIVVGEVARRLRYDAERAGSSIAIDAARPVIGDWDRMRIEQVVSNLLANAIKYGAGREIDLRVESFDDTARLTVRDHGVGIPVEDQERIFERFERVAPLRHYSGFGLGLWIVRRIVDAHEGLVDVTSRPGEGSTFTVELPMHLPQKSGERRTPGEARP